jgi:hypothetical protein
MTYIRQDIDEFTNSNEVSECITTLLTGSNVRVASDSITLTSLTSFSGSLPLFEGPVVVAGGFAMSDTFKDVSILRTGNMRWRNDGMPT